jgi:hypothetical protein
VKDEQIAYLQKMVDKLQAKFGIAPVIVKPQEVDKDKKPVFTDEDLGRL